MAKPKQSKQVAERVDAEEMSRLAENLANKLIMGHGTRQALRISRLAAEKVRATFNRMMDKYGEVT